MAAAGHAGVQALAPSAAWIAALATVLGTTAVASSTFALARVLATLTYLLVLCGACFALGLYLSLWHTPQWLEAGHKAPRQPYRHPSLLKSSGADLVVADHPGDNDDAISTSDAGSSRQDGRSSGSNGVPGLLAAIAGLSMSPARGGQQLGAGAPALNHKASHRACSSLQEVLSTALRLGRNADRLCHLDASRHKGSPSLTLVVWACKEQEVLRLHHVLPASRYRILTAHTPEQLLALLGQQPTLPDMLLLDLDTPWEDSEAWLEAVRKEYTPTELPVITLLGLDLPHEVGVQALLAGANDHMCKPLEPLELEARIQAQVQARQRFLLHAEAAAFLRLLGSTMPQPILQCTLAQQSQSKQECIAQPLPEVTVLFMGVRDFTSLSTRWSTPHAVKVLNELMNPFDELVARHGCHKADQTAGSYMAVAGHDGAPDHALRIMRLAYAMLTHGMSAFCGERLQISIGIHTGPAHSGVVGGGVPRFMVFGDTVVTAMSLQSRGVPGCALLSAAAQQCVRQQQQGAAPEFSCIDIGMRNMRGRGPMSVFLAKIGEWEAAVNSLGLPAHTSANPRHQLQRSCSTTDGRGPLTRARSGVQEAPAHPSMQPHSGLSWGHEDVRAAARHPASAAALQHTTTGELRGLMDAADAAALPHGLLQGLPPLQQHAPSQQAWAAGAGLGRKAGLGSSVAHARSYPGLPPLDETSAHTTEAPPRRAGGLKAVHSRDNSQGQGPPASRTPSSSQRECGSPRTGLHGVPGSGSFVDDSRTSLAVAMAAGMVLERLSPNDALLPPMLADSSRAAAHAAGAMQAPQLRPRRSRSALPEGRMLQPPIAAPSSSQQPAMHAGGTMGAPGPMQQMQQSSDSLGAVMTTAPLRTRPSQRTTSQDLCAAGLRAPLLAPHRQTRGLMPGLWREGSPVSRQNSAAQHDSMLLLHNTFNNNSTSSGVTLPMSSDSSFYHMPWIEQYIAHQALFQTHTSDHTHRRDSDEVLERVTAPGARAQHVIMMESRGSSLPAADTSAPLDATSNNVVHAEALLMSSGGGNPTSSSAARLLSGYSSSQLAALHAGLVASVRQANSQSSAAALAQLSDAVLQVLASNQHHASTNHRAGSTSSSKLSASGAHDSSSTLMPSNLSVGARYLQQGLMSTQDVDVSARPTPTIPAAASAAPDALNDPPQANAVTEASPAGACPVTPNPVNSRQAPHTPTQVQDVDDDAAAVDAVARGIPAAAVGGRTEANTPALQPDAVLGLLQHLVATLVADQQAVARPGSPTTSRQAVANTSMAGAAMPGVVASHAGAYKEDGVAAVPLASLLDALGSVAQPPQLLEPQQEAHNSESVMSLSGLAAHQQHLLRLNGGDEACFLLPRNWGSVASTGLPSASMSFPRLAQAQEGSTSLLQMLRASTLPEQLPGPNSEGLTADESAGLLLLGLATLSQRRGSELGNHPAPNLDLRRVLTAMRSRGSQQHAPGNLPPSPSALQLQHLLHALNSVTNSSHISSANSGPHSAPHISQANAPGSVRRASLVSDGGLPAPAALPPSPLCDASSSREAPPQATVPLDSCSCLRSTGHLSAVPEEATTSHGVAGSHATASANSAQETLQQVLAMPGQVPLGVRGGSGDLPSTQAPTNSEDPVPAVTTSARKLAAGTTREAGPTCTPAALRSAASTPTATSAAAAAAAAAPGTAASTLPQRHSLVLGALEAASRSAGAGASSGSGYARVRHWRRVVQEVELVQDVEAEDLPPPERSGVHAEGSSPICSGPSSFAKLSERYRVAAYSSGGIAAPSSLTGQLRTSASAGGAAIPTATAAPALGAMAENGTPAQASLTVGMECIVPQQGMERPGQPSSLSPVRPQSGTWHTSALGLGLEQQQQQQRGSGSSERLNPSRFAVFGRLHRQQRSSGSSIECMQPANDSQAMAAPASTSAKLHSSFKRLTRGLRKVLSSNSRKPSHAPHALKASETEPGAEVRGQQPVRQPTWHT